ncbi:Protein AAR2-like protein [Smittium mucronatum]|uniref:Protein AAR2-like protein n=1 Tax=Smittium mucronatum TaxID=133383 RepID=A0A1R0GVS0_9FUNG|nr:Protein AAR2-like protein [Smittium mucronatum]
MYSRWINLTNYISKESALSISPVHNVFSSATSSVYDNEEHRLAESVISNLKKVSVTSENPLGANDFSKFNKKKFDSNSENEKADSIDCFRFKYIDLKRSFNKNSKPEDISKYSIDKSWLLNKIISEEYAGSPKNLLGEIQESFLILLIGHNFSGLEHWKRLVYLVCASAESMSYLTEAQSIFIPFIKVLKDQLQECPEDFFSNVLTQDNFLLESLKVLSVNIENVKDHADNDQLYNLLSSEMKDLRSFFESRFGFYLPTGLEVLQEEEEDSDCAPVVVEI